MRIATSASRRRRLTCSRDADSSIWISGKAEPNCASAGASKCSMTMGAALTRTSPRGRRSCPLMRVSAAVARASKPCATSMISTPAAVGVYWPRLRSNMRVFMRCSIWSSLRSRVEWVMHKATQARATLPCWAMTSTVWKSVQASCGRLLGASKWSLSAGSVPGSVFIFANRHCHQTILLFIFDCSQSLVSNALLVARPPPGPSLAAALAHQPEARPP